MSKTANLMGGIYTNWSFEELLSVTTTTSFTSGSGGLHATPIYFVSEDEIHLYVFSDENSLHSRHISHIPNAAAAIYPECEGWEDLRGL